jgi:quercetin dioxygenase-like cupin family protein
VAEWILQRSFLGTVTPDLIILASEVRILPSPQRLFFRGARTALLGCRPKPLQDLRLVLRGGILLEKKTHPGSGRKEELDMAGVQKKSLDTTPDETRDFIKGEMQTATIRDFKVARLLLQPGWKWSEHVRPIAQTDSCQVRHTGYVISGQLKVVMDDRSETELGPGDAYVIEPGHDAWVVGNEPFLGVDVSTETVEAFAKEEEEAKGVIDRARDRLSGQ